MGTDENGARLTAGLNGAATHSRAGLNGAATHSRAEEEGGTQAAPDRKDDFMKVRFETTEAVYEWINTRLPEGMVWRKGWVPSTGITVSDDRGKELLCAVIYHDMSVDVAYVGWIAGNPENTQLETKEAMEAVLENLEDYCRMYGVEHLLAASGHAGIQKMFERAGFAAGDEKVRHFYRWMGGPGNGLKRN